MLGAAFPDRYLVTVGFGAAALFAAACRFLAAIDIFFRAASLILNPALRPRLMAEMGSGPATAWRPCAMSANILEAVRPSAFSSSAIESCCLFSFSIRLTTCPRVRSLRFAMSDSLSKAILAHRASLPHL